MGDEIAELVNHGYQMFLRHAVRTQKLPALAPQLTALHAFDEDLRQGPQVDASLYNVAPGTTSDAHIMRSR